MTPLPYAYLRVDRRQFQPGDAVEFFVRDAEGRQVHHFEVVGPDSQKDAWSAAFQWGVGYTVTYHHRGRSTLELTYSIHEVWEPGARRTDGRRVEERAEIDACVNLAHDYMHVADDAGDHEGARLAHNEMVELVLERHDLEDSTQ